MGAGAQIKELRLNKLLTQRQLAERLGVEPVTISRWERGEVPPSDLNRVRLAQFFNVHPNQFLGEEAVA